MKYKVRSNIVVTATIHLNNEYLVKLFRLWNLKMIHSDSFSSTNTSGFTNNKWKHFYWTVCAVCGSRCESLLSNQWFQSNLFFEFFIVSWNHMTLNVSLIMNFWLFDCDNIVPTSLLTKRTRYAEIRCLNCMVQNSISFISSFYLLKG